MPATSPRRRSNLTQLGLSSLLLLGACAPAAAHGTPPAAPKHAAKPKPALPPDDPAFGIAPPATLAVGDHFACAIRADERVACWGDNAAGQLGAGHSRGVAGPLLVRGLEHAVEVAAGGEHACARLRDGTVWCWGNGAGFRLGSDQDAQPHAPQRVPHVAHAVALGVGDSHGCAILESGGVRCWGNPDNGRLGLDHLDHVTEPANVTLDVERATGLALGDTTTCVRDGAGRVHCWGLGPTNGAHRKQTLPELYDVVKLVQAGDTCAWQKSGDITCFGPSGPAEAPEHRPDHTTDLARIDYDAWCALADRDLTCWGSAVSDPREFADESADDPKTFSELPRAKEIRGRSENICARGPDDAVSCWGSNAFGQLGRPPGGVYATPIAVPVPGPVIALEIGDHESCALARDGRIRCWGRRYQDDWPAEPNVSNVTSFAVAQHRCALHDGGLVACWGGYGGGMGELGSGPAPSVKTSTPQNSGILAALAGGDFPSHVDQVEGLPKATAIATAPRRSCALGATGVWCWGDTKPAQVNMFGTACSRFGGNPKLCEELRKPVLIATSQGATAIRAGMEEICMIRADQSVACWDHSTPRTIVGASAAVSLHAGTNQMCALDAAGALSCWMRDTSVAADNPYTEPLVAWSGSDNLECAVTRAGNVLCMGPGHDGQLGDGLREDSTITPRRVAHITNATSVRVGERHACALLSDGTVQCWGAGDANMARPDNTLTASATPVVVDLGAAAD